MTEYDSLGHIDYIVRYGNDKEQTYSYSKNADYIDEILKHLIANGKGLEVNAAGWKSGLSFAHPHQDVLKRYKELGGEIITIGSDAHKPEHVAYDFHKIKDYLEFCGFKYYTEFRQRKPHFCAI
jgi:histidinol-phosphatase (PHP family)